MSLSGENKPRPECIERRIKRRLAWHRAIVCMLKKDPALWDVPIQNMDRWAKQNGYVGHQVWREILSTMSREKIMRLLVSRSQRADQLRGSSPFVGIISKKTVERIREKYRKML
jgi:hypothetical protein